MKPLQNIGNEKSSGLEETLDEQGAKNIPADNSIAYLIAPAKDNAQALNELIGRLGPAVRKMAGPWDKSDLGLGMSLSDVVQNTLVKVAHGYPNFLGTS